MFIILIILLFFFIINSCFIDSSHIVTWISLLITLDWKFNNFISSSNLFSSVIGWLRNFLQMWDGQGILISLSCTFCFSEESKYLGSKKWHNCFFSIIRLTRCVYHMFICILGLWKLDRWNLEFICLLSS